MKMAGTATIPIKKPHKHAFKTVEWDINLGPRVINTTSTHGTFRVLHVCDCGNRVIEEIRYSLGDADGSRKIQTHDFRNSGVLEKARQEVGAS